jgi:hypothetical protein
MQIGTDNFKGCMTKLFRRLKTGMMVCAKSFLNGTLTKSAVKKRIESIRIVWS